MDIKEAVTATLSQSDAIVQAYLADIKPEELLMRPIPGINHIAWQVGHLINSEHYIVGKASPGSMPVLPLGFEARHHKDKASLDSPDAFLSKQEYMQIAKDVRAATLRSVEVMTPADFDKPVEKVPPFIKTAGAALLFISTHWMMHAGQWAVIRRSFGRAPIFNRVIA